MYYIFFNRIYSRKRMPVKKIGKFDVIFACLIDIGYLVNRILLIMNKI